jgi:hypothetical protein
MKDYACAQADPGWCEQHMLNAKTLSRAVEIRRQMAKTLKRLAKDGEVRNVHRFVCTPQLCINIEPVTHGGHCEGIQLLSRGHCIDEQVCGERIFLERCAAIKRRKIPYCTGQTIRGSASLVGVGQVCIALDPRFLLNVLQIWESAGMGRVP